MHPIGFGDEEPTKMLVAAVDPLDRLYLAC
jgi:hypothetical protein